MINVKELRLGNYVKDRRGKVIRIDFIQHFEDKYSLFGQVMKDSSRIAENSDYAHPIKVNIEWLERLGFKPANAFPYSKWLCEFEMMSLIVDQDIHYYGIAVMGKIVWSNSGTINVHQLQNLFFSLRREELTCDIENI